MRLDLEGHFVRRTPKKSISPYVVGVVQLLFVILVANNASADTTVTVSAEPRDGYKHVIFTFVQNDLPSMEGCFYNFMASGSRYNLEREHISAKSIATFVKPLSVIRIVAGPLRKLAQTFGPKKKMSKTGTVFFRTLITCYNGDIFAGDILSLSFETSPRGKILSINRLIKEMKFHMAYYDGYVSRPRSASETQR